MPETPSCEKSKKKIPCEIYSRSVGYYRPLSQWNKGKQSEFKDRKSLCIDGALESLKKESMQNAECGQHQGKNEFEVVRQGKL